MAVQHAGFRPHVDAVTCHARRRYRLLAKSPNVNAGPPDRCLSIVHYTRAEQQRVAPVSNVRISPQQNFVMQQRHAIEQQGRLETFEFLLHDRDRWPSVKQVPGRGFVPSVAGQAGLAHLGNARFAGGHYQGQQGPVAKRQRTSTVGMGGGQMVDLADEDIEGEHAAGDVLDVMSQREVSFHRFKQHHEWMEEVVSSPYATRQIEPVYLGLGLMGELSGLTKGVFETVEDAAKQLLREGGDEGDAKPVGKIPQDKMKTFEIRVNEYLEEGQAEIKRMKEEHAQRMAEMRKGKSLNKAEKRLRNARWIDDDVSQATLNGLVSGKGAAEKAEPIIQEVESAVGPISAQKQLKLRQAGGLKEKVVPQPEPPTNGMNGINGNGASNGMQLPTFEYSAPAQATNGISQPAAVQQAQPQAMQQAQQPLPPAQQQQPEQAMKSEPQQTMQDTSMGFDADGEENMTTLNEEETNFNIDDMDLDMAGDGDFDFEGAAGTPQAAPTAQAGESAAGATSAANQQVNTQPTAQGGQGTSSGAEGLQAGGDASFHPTPGDNSAFDEFTADDGLIDFEGGDDDGDAEGAGGDGLDLDLGLEGSAFGEAFQGGDEGAEGQDSGA